MEKNLGAIKSLLIGILVLIIFLMRKCDGGCPQFVESKSSDTTTSSTYDSSNYNITPDSIPYPVYIVNNPVPPLVDTAAILQAYFSSRFYSQVLEDTNIVITIDDTIRENEIAWRNLNYRWKKPVEHKTIVNNTTTIQPEPDNRFFLGANFTINSSGRANVGPEFIWVNKSNRALSLGVGVIDKNIRAGVLFPIFKSTK